MTLLSTALVPVLALICLTPWVTAPVALCMGIATALLCGNPYAARTRAWTPKLLSLSIIGLGAGMNLMIIAQVGFNGIGYTALSIALTVLAGLTLGRMLKVDRTTALLITVGTAICGGSAIAAVAPVIHAKAPAISIALGVVFILNAIALILFPAIGQWLNLSQHQFGVWSALAIHDTSSVVGAGLQYGADALQTGTTVKLARALWIVPLVLIIQALYRPPIDAADPAGPAPRRKYPWFILGFLAMAALMTWVPPLAPTGHIIEMIAQQLLVLSLFLIGTNLTRETLRAVGLRPFIQGIVLWLLVAGISLLIIQDLSLS